MRGELQPRSCKPRAFETNPYELESKLLGIPLNITYDVACWA